MRVRACAGRPRRRDDAAGAWSRRALDVLELRRDRTRCPFGKGPPPHQRALGLPAAGRGRPRCAWVADVAGSYTAGGLTRVDLETDRATTRLRLAHGPVFGVAAGTRGVWALTGPTENATVTRVDPRSGPPLGEVAGVHQPTSIAADSSGLWIATATGWILHGMRKVVRVGILNAPAAIALRTGLRGPWATAPSSASTSGPTGRSRDSESPGSL